MPKRITIHEEDYDRLRKMSHEEAGFVLHNLLHTLYGESVESSGNEYLDYFSEVVCNKMMRFVELSERQGNIGKRGGAPFGNQNAKKTTQKQPKNNPNSTQKQPKTTPNTNTNTNNNIRTCRSTNKFNDGMIIRTDIDFSEIESKCVKN